MTAGRGMFIRLAEHEGPLWVHVPDPIWIERAVTPAVVGQELRVEVVAVALVQPPTLDVDQAWGLPVYVPEDRVREWMAEFHECVWDDFACIDGTVYGPCSMPGCPGSCRPAAPCRCSCHGGDGE